MLRLLDSGTEACWSPRISRSGWVREAREAWGYVRLRLGFKALGTSAALLACTQAPPTQSARLKFQAAGPVDPFGFLCSEAESVCCA